MKRNQTQECRTRGRCFAVLAFVGIVLLHPSPVQAAHVDWDGSTNSINTSMGGNVDVPANWGPSGGGADGLGGAVPLATDDVFLNDVQSTGADVRTVVVNANQTWQSLAINQATAPTSGVTSNVLAVAPGVVLALPGLTPFTTQGAANAPVVIDLATGSSLAFSSTGVHAELLGEHSILSGSGIVSNRASDCAFTVKGTLAGPTLRIPGVKKNNMILGSGAVVTNPPDLGVGKGRLHLDALLGHSNRKSGAMGQQRGDLHQSSRARRQFRGGDRHDRSLHQQQL